MICFNAKKLQESKLIGLNYMRKTAMDMITWVSERNILEKIEKGKPLVVRSLISGQLFTLNSREHCRLKIVYLPREKSPFETKAGITMIATTVKNYYYSDSVNRSNNKFVNQLKMQSSAVAELITV